MLTRLAEELSKLPNHLLIEGHTDAKPFAVKDGNYTNWELSTDRGNAARRLMEAHGVRHEQVGQVRGFADRQLRHPEDPEHASNRRISVIVQYLAPPPEAAKPPGEEKKGGETGKVAAEEKKGGEATKAASDPPKAGGQAAKPPAEAPKAPAH